MKYENVNFYDPKTKALTLVKEITDLENKEVETRTYQHPFFANGLFVKTAIDLGAEFEQGGQVVQADLFNRLTNFIVELYNHQFTEDELVKGIDVSAIITTYIQILMGVLQGDTSKNE